MELNLHYEKEDDKSINISMSGGFIIKDIILKRLLINCMSLHSTSDNIGIFLKLEEIDTRVLLYANKVNLLSYKCWKKFQK